MGQIRSVMLVLVLVVLSSTSVALQTDTQVDGTSVVRSNEEIRSRAQPPSQTASQTAPIELEPGTPVDGDLFDDRPDEYVLSVERGQRVTINTTVRRLPPNEPFEVVVTGEPLPPSTDGEIQRTIDTNETVTVSFVADQSGQVLIRQRLGVTIQEPDVAEYTVLATLGEAPGEPNDDIRNATAITANGTLSDTIESGTVDFHSVEATAGHRVNVTFEREAPTGVTGVVLYGPDRKSLDTRLVGAPYPTTVSFVAETRGAYYIEVADVEDGAGNYTLTLESSPAPGERGTFTRDEFAWAKYGLSFENLSTETKGQIREIVARQPLVDGLVPSGVRTREEIARATFGKEIGQLNEEHRQMVETIYLAQFEGE